VDRLAEFFRRRGLIDLHIARVETQDVSDHQTRPARFDRLHDPPRCRRVVRERFFKEDRLARAGRGQGGVQVQTIRQAEADGVDIGTGQERCEIGIWRGARRGSDPRGARRIDVANGGKPGVRKLSVDARVAFAEPAEADNADAKLIHVPSALAELSIGRNPR